MEIIEKTRAYLQQNPGVKAGQIAKDLGITHKEINSLLNGALSTEFIKSEDDKWSPVALFENTLSDLAVTRTPADLLGGVDALEQFAQSVAEAIEEDSGFHSWPQDDPGLLNVSNSTDTETSRVLQFWRAVEFFTPQKIVKPSDSNSHTKIADLSFESIPPWAEQGLCSGLEPRVNRVWRHAVFVGVFELEQMVEDLLAQFPDDEYRDQPVRGESSVFTFALTDDGRPLFDTFVISSLPWAMGRTKRFGADSSAWLEGFDNYAQRCQERFEQLLQLRSDHEDDQDHIKSERPIGRPVTLTEIGKIYEMLVEAIGWRPDGLCCSLRVRSSQKSTKNKYTADDVDFLNSFYTEDLAKVDIKITKAGAGNGLRDYLSSGLKDETRRDIRKSKSILKNSISPRVMSCARWPDKGGYLPATSPICVVNNVLRSQKDGRGIFSVNGPPGSGKTTLLRDLVASIVVERATCLADLKSASDAFSGHDSWNQAGHDRTIHRIKSELKGFEIVVASSNNNAVANISTEIPKLDSVNEEMIAGYDYFSAHATSLLDKPAWGLLAAKLGKSVNRNDFVSRFWFRTSQGDDQADPPGFRQYLNHVNSDDCPDWKESVKRFKAAQDAECRHRSKLIEIESLIDEQSEIVRRQAEFPSRKKSLNAEIKTIVARKSDLEDIYRAKQHKRELAKDELDDVNASKPGFLEILFTLGRAIRQWLPRHDAARTHHADARVAAKSAREKLDQDEREHTKLQGRLKTLVDENQQYAERLSIIDSKITESSKSMLVPDEQFWSLDEDQLELASPWMSTEWDQKRQKVFLEALNLHKAFTLNNAVKMRQNLAAAIDLVSGGERTGATPEAIRNAWTTLFLVVPVVSTTFASYARMFNSIEKEEIGWLFIDEAGQASPQQAVGAIYRSKNTVVVGDPMQLEPITTLPPRVISALQNHFQLTDKWNPERESVQTMADRVNVIGTEIEQQDEKLWVGCPLRVHRRCQEPMFSISNQIAYSGMMVFGTPNRLDVEHLSQSCWIDVVGTNSQNNWVQDEGVVVERLLRTLIDAGVPMSEVYALSPFRDVSVGLGSLFRRVSNEFGKNTGTVHTFQGKEADVVILVLGGRTNADGPLQWAASRPNLLNVAVTRARERLFVIGDHARWRRHPHFTEMAGILPRMTDREFFNESI